MKIDARRVSIAVVLVASALCVDGCAGSTADDAAGEGPPSTHDGGPRYANDAASHPPGDAAQGPQDAAHDAGGGGLEDVFAPSDASDPQPSACSKNEDCAGFHADAGDVGEFCLLESCSSTNGVCLPTSDCPPANAPFCGCDGKTYASLCDAARAGVTTQTVGGACADDGGADDGAHNP